jgi:CheY-like chemotaxis protein
VGEQGPDMKEWTVVAGEAGEAGEGAGLAGGCMRARALLADDEQKVRAALRLLLENEAGVSVVGEAVDMNSLFQETKAIQPDLVLLDWELPGLAAATNNSAGVGLWGAQPALAPTLMLTLSSYCPDVRVIALSWRPEARAEALAAGVKGFISKVASPEMLLDVLDGVLDDALDVLGVAENCDSAGVIGKLQRPGVTPGEKQSSDATT